jgi:hypothetical protein
MKLSVEDRIFLGHLEENIAMAKEVLKKRNERVFLINGPPTREKSFFTSLPVHYIELAEICKRILYAQED